MRMTTLGRTGLNVTRTSFGALPIQRLSEHDAVRLVRAAMDAGINYFDTARNYTDSEHKLGVALEGARNRVLIATKTAAQTGEKALLDLETTLRALKTDYVDLWQFHNPSFVPAPGGEDGLYEAALAAKRAGKIRHIGITQHKLSRALEAVNCGLYETLQYPFNHLSDEKDVALVELCREKNVGFVAMKALSGGLVTNAALPFAYLAQYAHVVPIWGMQFMPELEQLLKLDRDPPQLDERMRGLIQIDREQLAGAFCRSCGYCLPCPVGIPIHQANRMTQLLTRAPLETWLTEEWRAGMEKIEDCTRCGLCERRCPYGLKPYETLPGHLAFYRKAYEDRFGG